jgi:hypothetical protein
MFEKEQPLKGAEKEGVGGFFKGIGKGIVGYGQLFLSVFV